MAAFIVWSVVLWTLKISVFTSELFSLIPSSLRYFLSLPIDTFLQYKNLHLGDYIFIIVVACFLGVIAKRYRHLDLLGKFRSIGGTEKFLETTGFKKPIIIFLSNGNVHIGILEDFELWSYDKSFKLNMIFSGSKNENGIVNYHTNYLELEEYVPKVSRFFYTKNILSMGELDINRFIIFLNKKQIAHTKTEKEMLKILES